MTVAFNILEAPNLQVWNEIDHLLEKMKEKRKRYLKFAKVNLAHEANQTMLYY